MTIAFHDTLTAGSGLRPEQENAVRAERRLAGVVPGWPGLQASPVGTFVAAPDV